MQQNSRWHTLETADQVAQAAYQQILKPLNTPLRITANSN